MLEHNRKIVLCAADLVYTRSRLRGVDTISVMHEIQSELERDMLAIGYLDDAPFDLVSICFRFGLKDELAPEYKPISKKYRDLPLSIEIDSQQFERGNGERFKRILTIAGLRALAHAGKRYGLPYKRFEQRLAEVCGENTV